MALITSAQNSKIKLARALMGRPKERREAGAFVAEGVRLVEDAAGANWPVRFVLYDATLSERGKSQVEGLTSRGVDVEEITPELMKSISDTETSQGILAVLNDIRLPIPESPTFFLIPDQIRDPGNLGTLIRSADAAGVDAVLIPPETTDPFAPKAVRAGMGAHFRTPVIMLGWDQIGQLSKSAKMQLLVADMNGTSCWDTDLRQPLMLIVGSEAEGASESAQKIASQRVGIPMAGGTDSLNAAVAGSILMFEVMRQRSKEK
jgi:TrmH family RNA methyltransferase